MKIKKQQTQTYGTLWDAILIVLYKFASILYDAEKLEGTKIKDTSLTQLG